MEYFLSLLPVALMYAVAGNLILSGVKAGLGKIMDWTVTDKDNKMYAALGKVIAILDKVIDWASANVEHKK